MNILLTTTSRNFRWVERCTDSSILYIWNPFELLSLLWQVISLYVLNDSVYVDPVLECSQSQFWVHKMLASWRLLTILRVFLLRISSFIRRELLPSSMNTFNFYFFWKVILLIPLLAKMLYRKYLLWVSCLSSRGTPLLASEAELGSSEYFLSEEFLRLNFVPIRLKMVFSCCLQLSRYLLCRTMLGIG